MSLQEWVGPWEGITIADLLKEICKVCSLLGYNETALTASSECTILPTWLLWQWRFIEREIMPVCCCDSVLNTADSIRGCQGRAWRAGTGRGSWKLKGAAKLCLCLVVRSSRGVRVCHDVLSGSGVTTGDLTRVLLVVFCNFEELVSGIMGHTADAVENHGRPSFAGSMNKVPTLQVPSTVFIFFWISMQQPQHPPF